MLRLAPAVGAATAREMARAASASAIDSEKRPRIIIEWARSDSTSARSGVGLHGDQLDRPLHGGDAGLPVT